MCGCGLSPRVRGNLTFISIIVTDIGSIPACAGEPAAIYEFSDSEKVYPRVCGGTPTTTSVVNCVDGLSPRVRGNPGQPPPQAATPGSIPACAGEPVEMWSCLDRAQVYPRVCGGTRMRVFRDNQRRGLSPRVRGNQRLQPLLAAACRSIPACAGEPHHLPFPTGYATVYPRVCGGTDLSGVLFE